MFDQVVVTSSPCTREAQIRLLEAKSRMLQREIEETEAAGRQESLKALLGAKYCVDRRRYFLARSLTYQGV